MIQYKFQSVGFLSAGGKERICPVAGKMVGVKGIAREIEATAGIPAICQCLDRQGYRFEDRRRKLRYAMSIACRAANCGNFDAIPLSRLQAIYNLYCEKNRVGIKGEPLTDAPISKN